MALIGKTFRERRLLLGLSQTEVTKLVGKKSAAYVAFIECGERNISVADFLLYCEALRLKPGNVLNFE